MAASYDRELIAQMLEGARRGDLHQFSVESIERAISQLRAADNADAAGVHTARRLPPDGIHTCSYQCDQPECIRAQRDDLAAQAERDAAEIVRLRGEVCSCPSGDGSLRWPCKAHPPEPIAPAEAKDPAPAMPNGVEGLIRAALESGFVVRKQEPVGYLTDEANAEMAWGVYRESPVPPHCAKDGSRQWFGPTPETAIRAAFKAMGILLPVARAADNRGAAGVEGNGPDLYSGPHAPCIHPKRPPAAVQAAHPAAGDKVRELVEKWRQRAEQKISASQHASIEQKCIARFRADDDLDRADELEAALQHRGDSRGGEADHG